MIRIGLDSAVYPLYATGIEQATTGGNEMTTITAKQIKLTNAMPGYYVHNNYKTGHTFDITKNNLGMWTVNHEDWNTDTKDTITAETLGDVRTFIASHY